MTEAAAADANRFRMHHIIREVSEGNYRGISERVIKSADDHHNQCLLNYIVATSW